MPCGSRHAAAVFQARRPSISMVSSSVRVAGGDDLGDLVVVVLDLVVDGRGPEAGQGVRVGAVDGDLERGGS